MLCIPEDLVSSNTHFQLPNSSEKISLAALLALHII
jgi:hypothetical protein